MNTKTVHTEHGTITGILHDGYSEFKGIRYATAGRWEYPTPAKLPEGSQDATQFGPRACQYKGFYGKESSIITQFYHNEANIHFPVTFSEDCLNLNLWVPEHPHACPVLVFIHGGSFLTGGNSESFIDGAAYARRGIIFASINYRLGPFAAMCGEGHEGNYQHVDQITALQWIRENIHLWGGNPNRITVMGESAGALSVQNILLSPLSKGLLQGAVMMSGGGDLSSLGTPTRPENIERLWDLVKKQLGASTFDELSQLPAATIYEEWSKAVAALPNYGITCTAPIVGNHVLPYNVRECIERDLTPDIPCIFGILSEDMWPHTLYTSAMNYALHQDSSRKAPVYTYYFDRCLPGDSRFGAFHAADLWYMFGTLSRNHRPFTDIDYRISEQMIDYVCAFARSGNPNAPGLPVWEPVTAGNRRSLRFGDAPAAMHTVDLQKLAHTQKTCSPFPYVEE